MEITCDDRLFESAADDLRAFAGRRLYLTGGTGFVGTSLLESIAWANLRLDARISTVVLSRDSAAFRARRAELCEAAAVELIEGDVRADRIVAGTVDGVIHAATPASAALNDSDPATMFETIVGGGLATLRIAARAGAIPVLFTSSGAVYGPQPPDLAAIPETYLGPPALAASDAYAAGKRVGEVQCRLAAASGVRPKIARLFAFIGRHLPLDRHFAIGNFLRDGLRGRTVTVSGDGTAVRSYLDASDMVAWLWAIFVRGEPLRPYNVGSARALDLGSVARMVAQLAPAPVEIAINSVATPGAVPHRYVPDVARAISELGVRETVPLDKAIERAFEALRPR